MHAVVADTTKVRIFKQITTYTYNTDFVSALLLIPQRYEFSSKSQLESCCYIYIYVVADTTKVRIFKQITTGYVIGMSAICCCWYHKGTNFQANHNRKVSSNIPLIVVADTTKVRIFKQITTSAYRALPTTSCCWYHKGTNFQANHNATKWLQRIIVLLLIPQRYEFSSKSQLLESCQYFSWSCCWYHKGTNFQANHNYKSLQYYFDSVVADTTKVRIFKQITTSQQNANTHQKLLLIPQRYEFSSKSQLA